MDAACAAGRGDADRSKVHLPLTVVRTVPETGSTNADVLELAGNGVAEGFWLRAERQTVGRGRQGRVWESPIGNAYASTLVRLRSTDPAAATLALMAAVALAEAVAAYLPLFEGDIAVSAPSRGKSEKSAGRKGQLRLKWPNDLMIDGAKVSGILLERVGEAVVIGMGVNLAHHPDFSDRPATSLASHGAHVSPQHFVETLAASFGRWLARWRGQGLEPVRQRWLELAHPAGTALTVRLPDRSAIDGLFDGLDTGGAMILRLADGTRRVIHAADVFLI